MTKRYYYYVSYVGMGSVFGSITFDTKEKIDNSNVDDILSQVRNNVEEKTNIKQVVILNFQELK